MRREARKQISKKTEKKESKKIFFGINTVWGCKKTHIPSSGGKYESDIQDTNGITIIINIIIHGGK
jgi:hypothetical protein